MIENKLTFRKAKRKDLSLILFFITQIAIYEKMEDQVQANINNLEEYIFKRKLVRVIFLVYDKKEIGFALFFTNFSTFVGRGGLYLEDLYILPSYRHRGFGKQTMIYLAKLAKEENLGRFEWVCLNWNTPSINFYESIGAKRLSEWNIFRLDQEGINKLSDDK